MRRANSEKLIGRKYCSPDMTPAERLAHVGWAEVDSGCWEWSGGRHVAGYGVLNIGGRSMYAHRIALEGKLGRPLGPSMQACHTCDNPPCVNPSHLFEGTKADNLEDMHKKGRARGPSKGQVGLSTTHPPDVFDAVFEMRAMGAHVDHIKEKTGLSVSYIYGLLSGIKQRPINYQEGSK